MGPQQFEGLTVGRNVHYVQPNGAHSAAIVTQVHNQETGVVDLHIMRSDEITSTYDAKTVVFSVEPKPYTWHWIERAGKPGVDEINKSMTDQFNQSLEHLDKNP